jgi:hypothetical protein
MSPGYVVDVQGMASGFVDQRGIESSDAAATARER